MEEFKAGGPQKEGQKADCICGVPCRPALSLAVTAHTVCPSLLTHQFFPAPLRHPCPHYSLFSTTLEPRMPLTGPFPPISSTQLGSQGSSLGEICVYARNNRDVKTPNMSLPCPEPLLTPEWGRDPAIQSFSSTKVVNRQEIHFSGMKAKSLNSFTIQFYLLTNKFKILGSSCSSDLVLPRSLKLSLGEQHTFPSHALALESPQQPCEVGTPPSLSAIPWNRQGN